MRSRNKNNQRSCCERCLYPLVVCVCSEVKPVTSNHTFTILQHPSESRCAKNTAHLVQLCVSNCRIIIGETKEDFSHTRNLVATDNQQTVVLYPAPNSEGLEKLTIATPENQSGENIHVILLDGTWKKAYKMWQLNPWLHALPHFHLNDCSSQYDIRKTPGNISGISTLEAVCELIKHFNPDIDTSPLTRCQNKMMQPYLRHLKNT